MGRKPNALILEFFERGPKLNDQSNRYQHTCRRCGQVFPKGRPDSLTRHLFEKCPRITEADRARALWQPAESTMQNGSSHFSPSALNLDMSPYTQQREPSGLDTLAEVSRQMQESGETRSDEAFMIQLQQHMTNDPHMTNDQHMTNDDDGQHSTGTHTHPVTSMTPATTPPHHDPHLHSSFPDLGHDHLSSTNEQLAEAAMQQSQSNASNPRKRKASTAPDPAVPNSYLSYYAERPPPAVDPQLQQPQQRSTDSTQIGLPAKLDHNIAFSLGQGGFGLLQRANKSKARGRFSEERRKEVQSIRKKGACLRCRMLKKPCSEGTPCGTCSNIEAARLWKGACLRTRVADEFGLYSTTYFYSKDRAKVYHSLNGNEPQAVQGRIEATLFPDSGIFATFPALKTNRAGHSADDLDPDLVNASQEPDIYLLSFKMTEDTLALKLERYLQNAVMQCISAESSPIIKTTLELAADLGMKHEDTMLTKFIHLWVATNLLVSKEQLWSLSYNQRDPPVTDHLDSTDKSVNGLTGVQSFSVDSEDYDIMNAQLQDAAERYCQKQAKTCLNELERRLLQRQQSSTFLTFLSAVIMLNCVERMTALYCSFDPLADTTSETLHAEDLTTLESDGTHISNTNPTDPSTSAPRQPDRFPDWPLSEPPSKFWPQGIKFAQLLQLLLRMRGLPPTTQINDDGTLSIVSNLNKAYPPAAVATNPDGVDGQQLLAAQWVDRTGLTASALWRVNDMSEMDLMREAWGTGDGEGVGAKAWDLKFLAPLLLPQRS